MPDHIECAECGNLVFGITSGDPRPLKRDDCPECGGTEFEA